MGVWDYELYVCIFQTSLNYRVSAILRRARNLNPGRKNKSWMLGVSVKKLQFWGLRGVLQLVVFKVQSEKKAASVTSWALRRSLSFLNVFTHLDTNDYNIKTLSKREFHLIKLYKNSLLLTFAQRLIWLNSTSQLSINWFWVPKGVTLHKKSIAMSISVFALIYCLPLWRMILLIEQFMGEHHFSITFSIKHTIKV